MVGLSCYKGTYKNDTLYYIPEIRALVIPAEVSGPSPGGSQYPNNIEWDNSKRRCRYGTWDPRPPCLGTWTLWITKAATHYLIHHPDIVLI